MSKNTDERVTPQELFDLLHKEFKFETDLAASHQNAKLPNYYHLGNSALTKKWIGSNFLNPPYSELKYWLYYGSQQKALIVWILPTDTSTKWFHNYIYDRHKWNWRLNIKVRFPLGRFKFSNSNAAKFASMIVIMDNRIDQDELAK